MTRAPSLDDDAEPVHLDRTCRLAGRDRGGRRADPQGMRSARRNAPRPLPAARRGAEAAADTGADEGTEANGREPNGRPGHPSRIADRADPRRPRRKLTAMSSAANGGAATPAIAVRHLVKTLRRGAGGARRRLRRADRRGLRLPGPQRRRQDDDDQHALHAHRSRRRAARRSPATTSSPSGTTSAATSAWSSRITTLDGYLTAEQNLQACTPSSTACRARLVAPRMRAGAGDGRPVGAARRAW